MQRKHWAALAGSLVLTGSALSGMAAAPGVDQEKAQAFAQENGTQAGTVDNLSGSTMNIAPYNAGSDVKAFDLPANVPIYQGKGKITSKGLGKGIPVRIHYRNASAQGQKPQVVAIEVLSAGDANTAKQQAVAAPALMMSQVGAAPPGPVAAQTPPPPPATPPPTTQPPPPTGGNTLGGSVKKQAAISSATGFQNGKIASIQTDKLYLTPYQRAAGKSELRLDQSAQVYQADNLVGTTALAPGTDVRVYFKNDSGQKRPRVVAVEILDPTKAHELEAAERNVPKKK